MHRLDNFYKICPYRGPKRKHTFVCQYVAPPGECYYNLQHSYVAIIFHRRVWYRVLSLRYACIQSSGIILIP